MSRIILIHWNEDEGRQRARTLRDAGYRVDRHAERGSPALRPVRQRPPDAFVIDLTRLPAEGCAVAEWLRQQKTLRHVPLVLVGAPGEKEARFRKRLPDATFTPWSRIRSALKRALRTPVTDPVVPPDAMAGYSGTPLPRKLGIKPGSRVALLGAPEDFDRTLGSLPEGATLRRNARGEADLALLFARSRTELVKRFPAATRVVAAGGSLWILWPKKASGVRTDLTQNDVRGHGLQSGWVDYKIAAVDATWSGLRFARRKK
jgi:CheY-like chemotaxis protein